MKMSPWKANSQSACQEIPHHSWNMKVHNDFHKSPLLDHTLSRTNPVHILKSNFFNIHFSITPTKQAGSNSAYSALNSVDAPFNLCPATDYLD